MKSTAHRSPDNMPGLDGENCPDPPQQFRYDRGIAPIMWVLIALSSIELATVHFLLLFWSRSVALALSALTGSTIVWLVLLIRSMRKLPVLLDREMLVLRVGTLRRFDVGRGNVARVRLSWESRAEKHKSVANLALIAYPNMILDLKTPISGMGLRAGATVSSIAHRLDDLPGFLAAMNIGYKHD